ncbi:hypothetical protein, partial [Amycolatopsis sp.]|uniref:hypothetical protein n=1 Tax=Amycolatopsis sp. TaxID=37632 RepID=UPI002D7F83C9
ANARNLAQEAEDAAKRAEQEQRNRDETAALGEAGPGGLDGANVRVDLSGLSRTSYEQLDQCAMDLSDPNASCDVRMRVHFSGVVFYWAVTCKLPGVAVRDCAGNVDEDQIDRREIADFPVERTIHITRADVARYLFGSAKEFIENFIPNLVFQILSDMRDCGNLQLSGCAWTASLFIGAEELRAAAQTIRELRMAIAVGRDVKPALAALQSAHLAPEVKAVLTEEAEILAAAASGCVVGGAVPNGARVSAFAAAPSDRDCAKALAHALRTSEDAKGGRVRYAAEKPARAKQKFRQGYHGRLPEAVVHEIMANPDAIYLSTGTLGYFVFRKGEDIVVTIGAGSERGRAFTSYGPSGPLGESGGKIFDEPPTNPGKPITHEMIVGGTVRDTDGGFLPAAIKLWEKGK